jgi:hypothetical protein
MICATDDTTVFGLLHAETSIPADHPLRAIRALLQPVLQQLWPCNIPAVLETPRGPARRRA